MRRALARGALAAIFLGALLVAFAYGYLVRELKIPPHGFVLRLYHWSQHFGPIRRVYRSLDPSPDADAPTLGLWRKTDTPPPVASDLTPDQIDEMRRLEALGYAAGYEGAPSFANVTQHDRARAWPGINLMISGHAPEAVLMDMDGKVLHRWSMSFAQAFPDRSDVPPQAGMGFWRRVHLFPNGDLLAIFDNLGLVKIDRNSRLLWANPCRCHHDVDVADDGTIYTVANRAEVVPRLHPYEPVLLDFLLVLGPDGEVRREVPLLEAFERSSFSHFLANGPPYGDLFHTNTVTWLDGSLADRAPMFRRGHVLLSLREAHLIAILDVEAERIVWAIANQWRKQHQPTLLSDGRLVVFDNQGGHEGRSRVIEIDPLTRQVSWSYEGSEDNGFASATGGSVQRLPNGNTLVTESDSGRGFEVTREGEVVWEYYNPARAGDRSELIANLCEVIRLEPARVAEWLPDAKAPDGFETTRSHERPAATAR